MTVLQKTITAILGKMSGINKSKRDFLTHVLCLFLIIRGKANFLHLGRYSDQYVESSFRLQFENYFDFSDFNTQLIKSHGSGHYVVAFDPTFIRKSGNKTPQIGRYWSGCSGRAERGLEAGVLAAIDVDNHTAFHIDAALTPNTEERQAQGISLVSHYVDVILWNREYLKSISNYLAVDAFFAKKEFIEPILQKTHLHIVSRLRDDANLRYLYQGKKKNGRGRPKQYAGKIDLKNPDLSQFNCSHEDETIAIYDAIVCCVFLKRKIRLAYTVYKKEGEGAKNRVKLYFCTDLQLPAWMIVTYYPLRFQEEFLLRDAKQFTGLQHCQARSQNKIEFHWNTALTAVNVAKVEHYLNVPKEKRNSFSMADVKTRLHNQFLIDRIFDISPMNGELSKNHPKILELLSLGCIAA